jgi:acetyl esterase
MKFAPGTDEFLARYHDAMPEDFFGETVAEQRRLYQSLSDVFPYEVPEGILVKDHELEYRGQRVRFRAYEPEHRTTSSVIVYFHGGGFVVGSPDSHHTVVAELAANTGSVAIAPWFRQAPEHPYPAAPEDCYLALAALAEGAAQLGGDLDTTAPILCGDSSGANLAVCVSMMCRDRGGPNPKGQALIGPVLDFARWFDPDPAIEFGDEMRHYTHSYCPDKSLVDEPYISPLVRGSFAKLPPAYIMSTEYDDLRDDAANYARLLVLQGIPVTLSIEPALVHAPIRGRSMIPQVADAWRRYCGAVAQFAVGAVESPKSW